MNTSRAFGVAILTSLGTMLGFYVCTQNRVRQTPQVVDNTHCVEWAQNGASLAWAPCPAPKSIRVCAIKEPPTGLESGAYGLSSKDAPAGAYLQVATDCKSGFAWYRP